MWDSMKHPDDFSPRDRERLRLEVKDAIRTIRGMAEGRPGSRSEVIRDGRRLLAALGELEGWTPHEVTDEEVEAWALGFASEVRNWAISNGYIEQSDN
jgi:hypothetical protein